MERVFEGGSHRLDPRDGAELAVANQPRFDGRPGLAVGEIGGDRRQSLVATDELRDQADPLSCGRRREDCQVRVRSKREVHRPLIDEHAGFGTFGPFAEVSLDEQSNEIDLNVRALVELTHVFLPQIEKNQGGIIQVASTAVFQPLPFMAVYGATKAFVLSFSEALWAEYRPRGVRVLALCPGATDTPFVERSGEQAAVGAKASPADLVRVGLAAFDRIWSQNGLARQRSAPPAGLRSWPRVEKSSVRFHAW